MKKLVKLSLALTLLISSMFAVHSVKAQDLFPF